jgi:hypothetical protein
MKIAIIGAGFFGSTAALILSKKHNIDLYEKSDSILNGASFANQFRFHLGYHYPRSLNTVDEIKKNYKYFEIFFGNSVFEKTLNLYGIASKKSKVSYKNYIKFLKKKNLKFREINSNYFSNKIEGQVISNEKNLNYFKVKNLIEKKLIKNKINIFCNSEFNKNLLNKYDKVIIATYDQNNFITKKLGYKVENKYRFELVEKIIVKLPKKYKKLSCIVLDGEFVCIDPYLGTKYHLLSDVKYSKLEVTKGNYPKFKHKNKKYLNTGLVKNIKVSKYKSFINHGSKYLPFIKKSNYVGSLFVTRAIKINKKKTDERLNEIINKEKKVISIFSGKWNTCLGIAKKLDKIFK